MPMKVIVQQNYYRINWIKSILSHDKMLLFYYYAIIADLII